MTYTYGAARMSVARPKRSTCSLIIGDMHLEEDSYRLDAANAACRPIQDAKFCFVFLD